MKSWLPALCLLLLPWHAASAEPFAPSWNFSAAVVGQTVVLDLTTRYVSCGMAARVERVEGTSRVTIWEALDGIGLDTVDAQVDCQCEPVGSSHGTGLKSCPEEDCTKDEQCACSKLCAQTVDNCPPPGALSYELFDLDGSLVQTVSLQLAESLPGCAAAVVESEPDAPEESSGGCSATSGTSSWAVWLGLLALMLLARPRRHLSLLLVLCVTSTLSLGCGRKDKAEAEAAAPGSNIVLEPVETVLEGTPWEQVLAAQTDLLEHFETSDDAVTTMRRLKSWRLDHLESFKADCKAALEHYAADSMHRMDYLVKAGRAWSVATTRIRQISDQWGPSEKHEAEILLGEFECH